jgi:hypothetical protein
MYVLSYQGPSFKNVQAVKVEDKDQASRYIAALPDGSYCGLVVTSAGEASPALKKLSGETLLTLYNALAYPTVTGFDSVSAARTALYNAVKIAAVPVTADMLVPPADTETQPEQDPATFVPDAPTPPVTTTPAADTPPADQSTQTEEANMAAKKTAKKTATKAKKTPKAKAAPKAPKAAKEKKVSDGLPRAGSKKAELLRLLQRANGATMKEMLDSTGWKACLGTAKAVATAAKLKFRHEKGEGDKPSRWYAE